MKVERDDILIYWGAPNMFFGILLYWVRNVYENNSDVN